jgi:hypothetical protein
MKKEGKGEEVFGHDSPIPVTVFEAGADDCAGELHTVRWAVLFKINLVPCSMSVELFDLKLILKQHMRTCICTALEICQSKVGMGSAYV